MTATSRDDTGQQRGRAATANGVTREAAEEFVLAEARLLDEDDYAAWLELWAEDGIYWIPSAPGMQSASGAPSIVYEDKMRMRDRVEHLLNGNTYAAYPPSRKCRIIGSFQRDRGQAPDEALVRSSFILVAQRKTEQTVLAGRLEHRLRLRDDHLEMVFKRVELVSAGDGHRNFTFLL